MKVGISQFRTIITVFIVVILVSVNFLVVYYIARENKADIEFPSDPDITYRTHNIADSHMFVSNFVGDQENTQNILKTLPLNSDITAIDILDSGINITVHNVHLDDESTQRDILYSAAVIMTMIKDATYVSYQNGTKIIEVTRTDVESFVPEQTLSSYDQQAWNRVRRSIPEAVSSIIEVRNTTTKFKEG